MKILPSPILPRRFANGFHRAVYLGVASGNFEFRLGQEVHHVFRSPIEFGVPFLPTEAFYFRHGNALHTDFGKRFANSIEREGLDDRGYKFHNEVLVFACSRMSVVCLGLCGAEAPHIAAGLLEREGVGNNE